MPTIGQGGTITLDAIFADATGVAVDPVAPLVSILRPDGSTEVANAVPTQVAVGRYEYLFAVPVSAPLGSWTARWSGTINGVAVSGDEVFSVVDAGSVAFEDTGPFGPCAVWPMTTTCVLTGASAAVTGAAARAASEVLWALSGRRFGICTTTYRPCREGAVGDPGPSWWPSGYWTPASCSHGESCGCTDTSEVVLPVAPLQRVVEIKVDGAVLVSGSYRIDDGRHIIRTDGGTFPVCQDFSLSDDEVGTWSVKVEWGEQVPDMGRLAVGELFCELVKAATADPACRLPKRVQTLTREGVTMAFLDPQEFLERGLTGLYLCDLFLHSFNPHGIAARSRVYSPDLPRARIPGS